MAYTNYPPYQAGEEEEPQDQQQQPSENEPSQDEPPQPSENEPIQDEPPPQRINASPRNNLYAPGTGPGTGRTAVRMGTLNRDGSTSPVGALGTATGPLSQPLPRLNPSPPPTNPLGQQSNQSTGNDSSDGSNAITGGLPSRPGRINAAPRNNLYAPGTGPGTGRTAVRMGTRNRDGSTSPVGALGAATGPLSQPTSRWMTPRPTPAQAFAQRQTHVDQAKASGTFDAVRAKFNAANPGHSMDKSGNITQRDAAPGTTTPLYFRARQPGGAAPATTPKSPAAPAQQPQFASLPSGQGGSKMVRLPPKPAPAAPATPPAAQPTAPRPPLAAAAGPAPAGKSALSIHIPSVTHTSAPRPPFAAAGQAPAAKPALSINIPSAEQKGAAGPPAKAPATFEGQNRDQFFGSAQQRQTADNAYAKAPKAPLAPPGASAPASTQKPRRK